MNSNHFLMKNPGTYSQTKQNSSQLSKNPDKPCQNPQFSDVIELAGNSGLLAAFRTFSLPKAGAQKHDPPEPAKLQAQILIKINILEK